MCGIAGLAGQERPDFAESMASMLRHRGPDQQSSWRGQDITLVQTRLAIVDLSPSGSQPFYSDDGRFVVVYNGEIYNHKDLRARHHLEVGPCDGAILPELWKQLGSACLSELRGMYAVAVYDSWENCLWLAVDPLGIKSLYVRQEPKGVAFASELMPLARYFDDKSIEEDASALFEAWGCLPADRSGLCGISRMAPGQVWKYDLSARTQAESSVDLSGWRYSTPTSWREVAEVFVRSVEAHLMADVSLGLMLSEGVDSAAIAWAAAECGRKLECFTLDLPGTAREGEGAKSIARAYGHKHYRLTSQSGVHEALQAYLQAMDRPTYDGLNVFLVASAMRSVGVTVALTGTGGDEVLTGYGHHHPPRIYLPDRVELAGRHLAYRLLQKPTGRRAASRTATFSEVTGDRGLAFLHAIARGQLAQDPYTRVRAYRSHHPSAETIGVAFPGPRFDDLTHGDPLEQLTRLEWMLYLSPLLLADADVFSMATGLETRLPFVDLDFVAAVLAVPDRETGKHGFVGATGDPVLAEVAKRSKTGFEIPVGDWMTSLEVDRAYAETNHSLPDLRINRKRAQLARWKSLVWSSWASRILAP